MAKIVFVSVTVDGKEGAVRAGSVMSEDEEGTLKQHAELVDNTEYKSTQELITGIAKKLNVSESIVDVEK